MLPLPRDRSPAHTWDLLVGIILALEKVKISLPLHIQRDRGNQYKNNRLLLQMLPDLRSLDTGWHWILSVGSHHWLFPLRLCNEVIYKDLSFSGTWKFYKSYVSTCRLEKAGCEDSSVMISSLAAGSPHPGSAEQSLGAACPAPGHVPAAVRPPVSFFPPRLLPSSILLIGSLLMFQML